MRSKCTEIQEISSYVHEYLKMNYKVWFWMLLCSPCTLERKQFSGKYSLPFLYVPVYVCGVFRCYHSAAVTNITVGWWSCALDNMHT